MGFQSIQVNSPTIVGDKQGDVADISPTGAVITRDDPVQQLLEQLLTQSMIQTEYWLHLIGYDAKLEQEDILEAEAFI